jgi:hypothetical protein
MTEETLRSLSLSDLLELLATQVAAARQTTVPYLSECQFSRFDGALITIGDFDIFPRKYTFSRPQPPAAPQENNEPTS